MPTWILDSIEIAGSGFLGGVNILFPKGLTCIIGARGSGKSTLTEAIRHGLGIAGTSKSSKDLIQANLSDALITLKSASGTDGAAYVIRRSGRQPAVLATSDGKPVQGVELERGTFLPLDAYSSNEIEAIADESLGVKRRALLDELRSKDLMEIQMALSEKRRGLDANRDAIRTVKAESAALREQMEELSDARARLAALPPAPTDDTSEKLMQATQQRQATEREIKSIEERVVALRQAKTDVDQFLSRYRPVLSDIGTEGSSNATLLEGVNKFLKSANKEAQDAVDALHALFDRTIEELGHIREELSKIANQQAAVMSQLQAKNAAAGTAIQIRAEAMRRVARLVEIETQRGVSETQNNKLMDDRKRLRGAYLLDREKMAVIREQVAKDLQREAGEKVRIRVLRNADSQSYQNQLATALQGAKVRNHDEIMTALLHLRPEELAQLIAENRFDEFLSATSLGSERSRKVFDAFREKLDPMQIELAEIEDRISIELNVASSSEPNFKDAAELSRGQKCTALLPLLLARRDTPLIVDQPEDNLDNHFIYETVVESIRRLKSHRQMIFVTHNANIPVLGEADLVVVLDSDGRKGFIRKSGTLDACRGEIIDLLEGGEEAFELRRRRYAK